MNNISCETPPTFSHTVQENGFSSMLKKWRKLRKFSQLDLALESAVSQRHISFLESGRAKPSREMVLALTEALSMPLRERNLILGAAGFAPVFKERALDSDEMLAVNKALEMTLAHHAPYPAIVVDRNWNLLLSNKPAQALIALLGKPEEVWLAVDPSGDHNIYRMTFHPTGFRSLISNWEQVGAGLLLRLQREVSADPCNHYLSTLLAEASEMIDTNALNLDGPIPPVMPMTLKIGGLELKTFSMISSFGTAQDVTAEELKVETFYPADEATRLFFEAKR